MVERLDLSSSHTKKTHHYNNYRKPFVRKLTLSNEEYHHYMKKNRTPRNRTIIEESDNQIKIEWNKHLWERFEDKVWSMFFHLNTEYMALGDVRIEIDEKTKQTRQIDGLFSDDDFIYIVECKWREKNEGSLVPPGDILSDITRWRGQWERVCDRLLRQEEFSGKKPVFVLVTRGVKHTPSLLKEVEEIGVIIDENQINGITALCSSLGETTNVIFRQELFRNSKKYSKISKQGRTFPSTMIEVDGYKIYNFFALSEEVIDLSYVPRRSPTDGDLSQSYQRALKPSKVQEINRYLSEKGSFFPNSIIMASEEEVNFSIKGENSTSKIGLLELPDEYGSLFVIDGQHRLFGSESSDINKPVSFCLICGLDGSRQAHLFTTINQKQSRVPPDLLWDLYGDLGNLDSPINPDNKSEVDQALRYIISNIWKKINTKPDHPLFRKIVIPSQTVKTADTWISFGNTFCKYLFARKKYVWEPGYLLLDNIDKKSLNYATKRVSYFFHSLRDQLDEEWNKNQKENWLLSNYSLIVITQMFTHMVSLWGGLPSTRESWRYGKTGHQGLIDDFTKLLSEAIISDDLGFHNPSINRNIKKAGSSSARGEFLSDLVKYIRKNGGSKYQEFAPSITDQEEIEGDAPSINTEKRTSEIEQGFRSFIYSISKEKHGDQWYFEGLPNRVQQDIKDLASVSAAMGKKYDPPYEIDILDELSTRAILHVFKSKETKNVYSDFFPTSIKMFENNWDNFCNLRNTIAHRKHYPSDEFKESWLASLSILEMWLDQMNDDS